MVLTGVSCKSGLDFALYAVINFAFLNKQTHKSLGKKQISTCSYYSIPKNSASLNQWFAAAKVKLSTISKPYYTKNAYTFKRPNYCILGRDSRKTERCYDSYLCDYGKVPKAKVVRPEKPLHPLQ